MNSQINEIAFTASRHIPADRGKQIVQRRGTLEAGVKAICSRVREYPGHPLTLVDMEKISGFSRRSLENEFHRQFGCSPIKWQQIERLQMAHEYLTQINGKIAIGDLSYQFGFVSSSKFIAYYKRCFNETPKDTAIRIRHAISFKGDRRPRAALGLHVHPAE
jgi:transcriptional regulator GlxA family with amidase domain